MTARQLFERYSPDHDDAPVAAQADGARRPTSSSSSPRSPSEQEPHSTLAAFLINPDGDCHWVHAGDSRIYHFHGGQLVKRTMDHSYVQTLVDRGELTEDEANVHPQSQHPDGLPGRRGRSAGRRALHPAAAARRRADGLQRRRLALLQPDELGSVLSSLSPREASEFLIEKARSRGHGGGDNMSLVIVKLEPLELSARPVALRRGTGNGCGGAACCARRSALFAALCPALLPLPLVGAARCCFGASARAPALLFACSAACARCLSSNWRWRLPAASRRGAFGRFLGGARARAPAAQPAPWPRLLGLLALRFGRLALFELARSRSAALRLRSASFSAISWRLRSASRCAPLGARPRPGSR